MNETAKNIWTRPWGGPGKRITWFLLLFGVTFLAIWFIVAVTELNPRSLDPAVLALFVALVLSVLASALLLFLRWLCAWEHFRRFLFGLTCLGTLVALAYAEENWRGKYLW